MNLSILKQLNSLIFCLGASAFINAQTPDPAKLQAYKSKYPGSNVIITNRSENVKIDLVKGIPVVKTSNHDEFLILNQSGVAGMTSDEIYFSSFETIEDIDAYSLIPTEKGYKKIKADNFVTKAAETEGSVFHDDNKITSYMFPGLTEGAYRIANYTEISSENRFPFGFNFSSYLPLENGTYIIDCDSSIHIKFQLFNDKKGDVKFKEEIIKGRRIQTWTISNPILIKQEERAAPSRYYSLHIMAQIAYYNTKKGKIQVVETATDLHNWYKDHIKNVLTEEPSDEMKQVTDSIIKNKGTELEKVKAVYYWVQSNIKYIAFEEGINGFVPRQPNSILTKRYGDCKDMASLIYSMLKYAKVKSYLTWIGTRDLPYKYSEFPSSICDNHMITTYLVGDKPYFLDATCSFLPFGFPSHGIISKEAFLHISDNEYKILNVPTMTTDQTNWRDTSYITFENRKIIGHSKTIASGFYNVYINEAYKDLDLEKLKEVVQNINEKGNNTFKVTSASVKNVGERDSNLMIDFAYEINNYVTSYDNEVYVNMVLDKDITMGELKQDRVAPFWLDNVGNDNYTVFLEIPKGYKLKSLPKNATFNSDFVDYSIEYTKVSETSIKMTVKLRLKFLLLYPESFAKWNEFAKIMKTSINETVVLQKI
ncbi:MAG: transglutaminase domain-containing protein [Flavobacteriia bacterium]|nr:transglutaminase domain-containing protein [Flavobacteriia bacterium]